MEPSQRRAQIGRAVEALGRALDLLREFDDLPDAQSTRFELSATLSSLAEAGEDGAADVARLSRITDGLRGALARMQDACAADPALEPATGAIARAIAVLFPLCRPPGPAPGEQPIQLVRRAPAGTNEAPIPLTARRAPPAAEEQPLPLAAKPVPAARQRAERRALSRREITAELGIQSETNFYTGFACDISSGGLFVATYDLPPIGAEVSVNFRLPGGPLLSLLGTVRWVREANEREPDLPPGMGVEFAELGADEAGAINDYIARNPPLFFEA